MLRTDARGCAVTGASANAVALYDTAIGQFQRYAGDPVATIDQAIADSPGFVMAHAMRAWMHLLGTEAAGLPVAGASLDAAAALTANAREAGHLAALRHLVDGRWHEAARTLEDVTIEHPLDALALQAGHLCDFFVGNSRNLRDRIARALPAWSEHTPGYHAVLGMHAFGLEETGLYQRAEAAGRRAVELEPTDAWAQHAVAHVLEMQGRQRDGIAWMRANPAAWSADNFMCVHNWWHLALYHLDLDEIDTVLELFDGPIYGARSQVILDMVDASALLWRLHLRGIEVGDRWNWVADGWEPVAGSGNYAFNDAHAMMAFVGAGRREAAAEVLVAQQRAMAGAGDNAAFTREVGQPVTRAVEAFGRGAYGETVRLLRPVRAIAHRFGGSHAQRDIIDLTLIEAAIRDGQASFARALAAERFDVKPTSPGGAGFLARLRPTAAAA